MTKKLYMTEEERAQVPNLPASLLIHAPRHSLAVYFYQALQSLGYYPISFREPLTDGGHPLDDPEYCGIYLDDLSKREEVELIADRIHRTPLYKLFLHVHRGEPYEIKKTSFGAVNKTLRNRALIKAHIRNAELGEERTPPGMVLVASSHMLPNPDGERRIATRLASQFGIDEPYLSEETIYNHIRASVKRIVKRVH